MGAAMRRIHMGNALSAFGLGFTVPYLYVYVAQVRGLGAMTAGLVLAVFAVAALVVLPFAAATGVALALAEGWVAGALAIIAWSIAYVVIATVSVTLRQQVTPEPLMSRVMTAGRMVTFGLGYPVGALVAGGLAGVMETDEALLLSQLSLAVAAVIAWSSSLRHAPRRLEVAD
jgi:hypothetical protein